MTDAIPVNRKGRGRPRIGAKLIGVRIPPKELAALDRFIRDQPSDLSRPFGVRVILHDWLVAHGYTKPDPELDVIQSGSADSAKTAPAAPAKRRRSRHQEMGD